MKHIITLFVLLSFLVSGQVLAGDVTYRASMNGIECTGCKKSIAKSLGKLKGVKTIRIAKGSGNNHSLTVITDGSSSISKSQAVGALGKNAPHYTIVSWSRSN
ncbi:MAG: heavy metal-associated domain-containing protein [Verrucomicrobiales bacterium]|nr:heavy metal-associated domain-containing protein [Verrucomicrobiales bacterium]